MLTTVEGVYKQGKVELTEVPEGVEGSRVLVTFLPPGGKGANGGPAAPQKGEMMRLGMFPQLSVLTDEDFKAAEFHGDDDDGLDWR